ncbi:hypothetical protein D3C81_464960 [compost metagenome]
MSAEPLYVGLPRIQMYPYKTSRQLQRSCWRTKAVKSITAFQSLRSGLGSAFELWEVFFEVLVRSSRIALAALCFHLP